jgi:DNA-binding response OmpR family regulator
MSEASMKVLVVDDEPFILRSLTFVLRKEKFEVIEAKNGEEGLQQIRAHHPDLVFCDVMMPKKNGYEVVKEVRADPQFADVFFVLLTAKGQESDREMGKNLGADEYMTKPFSPSRIIEKAREVLAAKARR